MEILNVKERKLNKDLIGYLVNGQIFVPIGAESQEFKEWLAEGNIPESEFTVEEIEEQRVQNINSYTQSFIYSKYQQPKQSSANLGVYDEAYKNEMVTFIRRVVDLSNEAIENNISFEDYKAIINNLELQLV